MKGPIQIYEDAENHFYVGKYQEINKRVGPNNVVTVFSEINKICYTIIRQVKVSIFWYFKTCSRSLDF